MIISGGKQIECQSRLIKLSSNDPFKDLRKKRQVGNWVIVTKNLRIKGCLLLCMLQILRREKIISVQTEIKGLFKATAILTDEVHASV